MLRTTLYLSLLSLLYCGITVPLCSGSVLVWNRNTEDDLAGYNVYYGESPGDYSAALDVGNRTEYDCSDLTEGITYYIAVTAYDHSNNESAFSSELVFFADDGIPYSADNCPDTVNHDQQDSYPPGGNGIGDACECEGDLNNDGNVDGDDSFALLQEVGRNYWHEPCTNDNPCACDFDCNGSIDISDVIIFLEDLGRNIYYNPCPDHEVGDWCSY